MKNNYPVKYAVMPIKNCDEETMINIVSKCYLLSEEKRYDKYGKYKTMYDVFFPYQLDDRCWKRVEPIFNIYSYRCVNALEVDAIFDSYENALELAHLKNNEILTKAKKFAKSSQFDAIENRHKGIIKHYQDLQMQIDDNTIDLMLDRDCKSKFIQSALVSPVSNKLSNFYRFKNCSLYSCLDSFYSNDAYYVYSVSNSEFFTIRDCINYFDTYDEFKKSVLPNYDDSKYLLFNDPITEITEIANPNENVVKGSYYLKDDKMYYDENMVPYSHSLNFDNSEKTIIYTMETYENILMSYLPKLDDVHNVGIQIGGKVLKNRLYEKEW
ncbi:MAG: hypothetical protein HFI87_07125 [Bacilli bacterium]|nr:hypothetical protein [Bacilli bacterium]